MRFGFAGTPLVAAKILQELVDSGLKFEVVITKPDAFGRRGNIAIESEVAKTADALNIPVVKPESFDKDFATQLTELGLDVIIVVAYGRIIPVTFLDIPRYGWFNLHFSLLPKFRGASPIQTALLHGEPSTGVSLFKIDQGLDTGPILMQREVNIADEDDALTLFDRLQHVGTNLIIESMELLNGSDQNLKVQPIAAGPEAKKLNKELFAIDWRRPSREIFNQVRALCADGCAYTSFNGTRIKIRKVALANGLAIAPGKVVKTEGKIVVGTGNGVLELLQVQPEGKQQMDAASWHNGVRISDPEFS